MHFCTGLCFSEPLYLARSKMIPRNACKFLQPCKNLSCRGEKGCRRMLFRDKKTQ
eukprot:jgi/Antlo1/947/261